MSNMHLVTGYQGKTHVTAADHGAFWAGLVGTGNYVFDIGQKFAATKLSDNQIRIADGEMLIQGRHARIPTGETVDLTIENGTAETSRIDLVVVRYTKSEETGVEDANPIVLRGEPSETTPYAPEHVTGVMGEASIIDVPLYKIHITDVTIESIESVLPEVIPAYRENVEKVNELEQRADETAERLDKFAGIHKVGDILVTKRNLSKDKTFVTASGTAYLEDTYPELDSLLGTTRKTIEFTFATDKGYLRSANFINGKYYLCTIYGLWSSVDGMTWEQVTLNDTHTNVSYIAYTNGIYLAFAGNTSDVYSISNDGVTWRAITTNTVVGETTSNLPKMSSIQGVFVHNGKFFVVGGPVYVSTDGMDWTKYSPSNGEWLLSGNGVTVGFDSNIFLSPFSQAPADAYLYSGEELYSTPELFRFPKQIDSAGVRAKVIFDDTTSLFVAVYLTYVSTTYTVRLATSPDMMNWTHKKDFGNYNTMYFGILATSEGYVVAVRNSTDGSTYGTYIAKLYSRDFKTVTTLPNPTTALAETSDRSAWATDGNSFILADTNNGYTIKKYMTVPKLTHSNYNTYVKARSDE